MKTIEEAAILHIYDCVEKSEFDRSELSFKKGVEFAQRWIPVEEELPEMSLEITDWIFTDENEPEDKDYLKCSINVLIKTMCGCVLIANIDECGGWHSDDLYQHEIVTHWRPIELK